MATRSESKNNQAGPRERILAAALDLYYRQGYANTSVDQIIERAGAYKKSFYRYFPTREDLGREYLLMQAEFFFAYFRGMLERYTDFEDFLKSWMRILRREAREGVFVGCPFAFLAAEVKGMSAGRDELQSTLKRIVALRRQLLAEYLRRCSYRGRALPAEFPVTELADRIILVYQGGIGLFAMSGDQIYIRGLEQEIAFAVQASVADYSGENRPTRKASRGAPSQYPGDAEDR